MSTSPELITIRYEVWNGDASTGFLGPMPRVIIMEVLRITLADGAWIVTSNEPNASPEWIGRDETKQVAILNYLKARLDHYEEKQS